MENKINYKNIIKGFSSIFIYFFVQSHSTDLFNFFNIDINSINIYIRFLYNLLLEIVIIASIFLINYQTIINDFNDLKKNHKKYFSKCINYWLISLIVMMLSNFIIIFLFDAGIADNENAIRDMLRLNPLYVYVSAVILAPFVEELVFRQSFRNIFHNKYLFIIISSLIFGGLHITANFNSMIDLLYLIPYCSTGVAFAYMLVKTKNIFVSISFHLMHNGILVGLQILLLLVG